MVLKFKKTVQSQAQEIKVVNTFPIFYFPKENLLPVPWHVSRNNFIRVITNRSSSSYKLGSFPRYSIYRVYIGTGCLWFFNNFFSLKKRTYICIYTYTYVCFIYIYIYIKLTTKQRNLNVLLAITPMQTINCFWHKVTQAPLIYNWGAMQFNKF